MKRLISLSLVLASLATVAGADEQTLRKLKACGSEARNSFGYHTEFPAVSEGNGYVSFETEEANAEGTFQRYSLVNCATRSIIRIEADYKLKDSASVRGFDGDLLKKIKALRKASRLANEAILPGWAKGEGFKVTVGKAPKRGDAKAERLDCGCATYFPEM